MAKKSISSTDLIWIIHEKIKEFGDCPDHGLTIAIVPTPGAGWSAVVGARQRTSHPLCARRVEQIEKQLRGIYVLKG
jgi:hypothetical protein